MNRYAKYFDESSKYMNDLAKDEKMLKKELKSELVYSDKHIKTEVKIYNDKVHTHFQHNKIRKDNEHCACLPVTLLDSIFVNSNKKYYPQIFLEECKLAINVNAINEDLELSELMMNLMNKW